MNYCRNGFSALALIWFCLISCGPGDNSNITARSEFEKPWLILELEGVKLLVSEVANNLDEPWEIAWGPDNYIWVTEHKGVVKRINPNTGAVKDVLTITDIFYANTPGLLGMVLHPDFNTDPFIYVHHNYVDSSATEIDHHGGIRYIRSKVVRYRYDSENDTLTSPEIILVDIPGNIGHNGSRLAITADKKLLLATGDTGSRGTIRDKNVLTGKVLRMNLDGSIPEDNPVSESYFYSMGHRNQQGLVVAKGKIYTSEHGPNNDDELNLITPGGDYGWPYVEGFCDNENERNFCDSLNVIEPLMAWTPTIAPAGLDFYDHPSIPEWQNSLMLTSLKGRSLQVLKLDHSGEKIIDKKFFLQKQFGRFRDLCVSSSGDVYLITSNTDWHINRHQWMYDNVPEDGNDRIIKLSPINQNHYPDLPVIREDSAQIQLFTQERINFNIPGTALYIQHCAPCHLPGGQGIPNSVPPLVNTEWISDRTKLIETTLGGMTGNITVNGQEYDGVMPGFAVTLTDEQVVDILNYVLITLNSYQTDPITAQEVSESRSNLSQP